MRLRPAGPAACSRDGGQLDPSSGVVYRLRSNPTRTWRSRDGAARSEALMRFVFSGPELPDSGSAVVAVLAEKQLSPAATRLDESADGAIGRALSSGRFTG